MTLKKLVHHLKKSEKIALAFLALVLIGSSYTLGRAFYLENTEVQYVTGGTYVEGVVGTVDGLNPLYAQQGTIAQDIAELIFAGLTKYDTETGEIVGDLANVKVSENGKEYTFVIKENAKWHDGETVTADDVIFTYEGVIKNPEFKGNILNYNDYSGIRATKIDDRTVQFLLEKPDAFFLVKTMVGILPKHVLEVEQIAFLKSSPFNFNPVGAGPYRFVSQVNLPTHQEYGLEAFTEYYDGEANIKSILFKIYSDYDTLLKNLSGLSGIRNIPNEFTENVLKKDRFALSLYELPQYVAVFINNEADKLKETNVRLALQLGTDKEALVKNLGENKVIDTPLLEIDQENWVHQHSIKKANGALFETQWQVPNKDEVVEEEDEIEEEEVSPTAEVTSINSPNEGKDWTTTKDTVTITGTAPGNAKAIIVNDYELQKFTPGDPGWSYVAATKFDSLKPGDNVYEVYAVSGADEEKELIDAITITYSSEEDLSDGEKETLAQENAEAINLPIRENRSGETLTLKLVTSAKPAIYADVAQIIKEQWQKIGVGLEIVILDNEEFQGAIAKRDYDLLLFGQNLGYNLDAYPYWHSSQAKEEGLNLSQFKNFVADSLLEKARLDDEEVRQKTLANLQEIISQEVPAVFLYSPTYYTALDKDISHPDFKHLATTSDRLSSVAQWHANVNRRFKDGVNPFTFIAWLFKQF